MRSYGLLVLTALALFVAAGCEKESATSGGSSPAGASVSLIGAGASFPYPIYSKWVAEYSRLHPNVRINYQSIGSGAGIRQITERTVDFGASDGPMTDEQLKQAPGTILHIPMVLGAVVPVYNMADVTQPLRFTGPVLADLYLGRIKKWNDPRLVQLNPDAKLPDADITIVHRSDGSGTSYIFTDYLAKVSPEWASGPGRGTSVNWPAGLGGKGNEGVTGIVKQTPGSLGYVELIYALANKVPYGNVQNPAGAFVQASMQTVSAAAAGAVGNMPEDLRVSITNAQGQDAYPISGMTWILAYQDQRDPAKGKALVDYLWWCIHDGQAFAPQLHYAALPPEVVKLAEKKIQSITAGGKPMLAAR